MIFASIVVFSLLGSVGSVALAAWFLRGSRGFSPEVKTTVLGYATGTMLAAALLGMIPHASKHLATETVLVIVLAGIVSFFVLEKLLVWRHCHEQACPVHSRPGALVLIGDAVHNAVDGVAIALAFLHSPPLGIATSIAVIAHEIPQEVGDFMILLHDGYSRSRALLLNTAASLTTLGGALAAFWLGARVKEFAPHALAVSAASFLYIALADLTPDHRSKPALRDTLRQLAGLVAGIATITLLHARAIH